MHSFIVPIEVRVYTLHSYDKQQLVRVVLDYAGNGKPGRTSDIFGLEGAKGVIKKVFGNVKVCAHMLILYVL